MYVSRLDGHGSADDSSSYPLSPLLLLLQSASAIPCTPFILQSLRSFSNHARQLRHIPSTPVMLAMIGWAFAHQSAHPTETLARTPMKFYLWTWLGSRAVPGRASHLHLGGWGCLGQRFRLSLADCLLLRGGYRADLSLTDS